MEQKTSKPKPALVHDHEAAHTDSHVTWDEETIALHDLDRGTRQKIDEPNTPYHYYVEGEAGGVSPARSQSGEPPIEWDELQSKLQDVQDKKKSEWDSDDDSAASGLHFVERDAEGKKIHKDPHFAEKRKLHYNEFERVRAWKMQHAGDEDDEEEEKEKPKEK